MRRNLKAAERLEIGAPAEWRNGGQWLPATVIGAPARDVLGFEYVPVRNERGTRTVGRGEEIRGYSGGVRAA